MDGIDPERDVKIGPVPGAVAKTASFGLMAAKALEEGKLDGFWANGMGAEVAVRNGIGTLVLDARRERATTPKGYTFPALVTSRKSDPGKPGRGTRGDPGGQGRAGDPEAQTRSGRPRSGRSSFPPPRRA